jgi:hypothetical protein
MLDHSGASQFYDSPDGDLGRNHRPISQYADPPYTPFDGPPAQNQLETLLDDEDRGHDEQIRPGYNLITAEHFGMLTFLLLLRTILMQLQLHSKSQKHTHHIPRMDLLAGEKRRSNTSRYLCTQHILQPSL